MAKDTEPVFTHRTSRIPRILPPEQRRDRSLSAPSKFEQLANAFKQKIQIEQEEKLLALEDKHGKHMKRHNSMRELNHYHGGSYHGQKPPRPPLKEVFAQPDLPSGKFGKPPLPGMKKRSAGRDKGNPLPPLSQNQVNSGYTSPGGSRSGSASSVRNNGVVTSKPPQPFPNKPRMARPHKLNSRGSEVESGTDSDINMKPQGLNPLEKAKLHKIKKREAAKMQYMESSDDESLRQPTGDRKVQNGLKNGAYDDQGLSDFQKWQRDQDQARQERLQNYANKQNNAMPQSQRTDSAHSNKSFGHTYTVEKQQSPSPKRRFSPAAKRQMPTGVGDTNVTTHVTAKQALLKAQKLEMLNRQRSQQNLNQSSSEDDDDDDTEDEEDEEALEKQRQLEALIAKQEEELEQLQREREAEAERERLEAERQRRRYKAQKERRRRLQEAEEQERIQKQEEERGRQRRQSQAESQASVRQESRQSSRADSQQKARKKSITVPALRRPSLPAKEPLPKAKTPEVNENTAFYLEQAATEEAAEDVQLQPCASCGRKFAADRLSKHTKVCKANAKKKPRKQFDVTKMRVQGTEAAQFVDTKTIHTKPDPKPSKNKDWRAQHEDFISTIRYAKKVSEVEAKGGNLASLPPPPPTKSDNFVPCPHCNRKFNPSAAERHIPLCQNLKSKPKPFNTRTKRY